MEENLGSLNLFIQDFPEAEKYWNYFEKVRRSELETRTSSSPKSLKSFKIKTAMPRGRNFTPNQFNSRKIVIRKRTEKSSLGKLSMNDGLRADLMLSRNHELLRSMRFNFRAEENRVRQINLETGGLEKILNTLRKPISPNEKDKFKPYRPLYFSPNQAMKRTLQEDRNTWICKRKKKKSA